MRKKSQPSRFPNLNNWSLEEIYGHYRSIFHSSQQYPFRSTASLDAVKEHPEDEGHDKQLQGSPIADISDLDKPERVMGLISSSQDSQVKNHNTDKSGKLENANQPAHYRIRKKGNMPRSVRDYLRIARSRK